VVGAALVMAAPGSARADEPADERPRVHVESNKPEATLFAWVDANTGKPICRAPCDQTVDTKAHPFYYFAGPGLVKSGPFSLHRRTGLVNLDVEASHSAGKTVGLVATVAGGSAVLTGIPLLFVIGFMSSGSNGGHGDYKPVPLTMLGVGSAVLLVGLPLFLTSRTTVKISGSGLAFAF
jgi:hypothetical protein